MAWFWAWVRTEHDALSVVLTALALLVAVAGVVVAVIYARLTRKLAVAANRQADLTEALFETGHRPWLAIVCDYDIRQNDHQDSPASFDTEITQHRDFSLSLENKGSVPAIIVAWQVLVGRDREEPRISRSQQGVETVVYPDVTERLTQITISDQWKQVKRLKDGEMIWEGGEEKREAAKRSVRLETSVTYRGVAKRHYVTEASIGLDLKPASASCARRCGST